MTGGGHGEGLVTWQVISAVYQYDVACRDVGWQWTGAVSCRPAALGTPLSAACPDPDPADCCGPVEMLTAAR